jgi:hypothetical protein
VIPPSLDPLKKFSDELHVLAARFDEQTVTLRELIAALGARASALLGKKPANTKPLSPDRPATLSAVVTLLFSLWTAKVSKLVEL